jgi:hypothetical protein
MDALALLGLLLRPRLLLCLLSFLLGSLKLLARAFHLLPRFLRLLAVLSIQPLLVLQPGLVLLALLLQSLNPVLNLVAIPSLDEIAVLGLIAILCPDAVTILRRHRLLRQAGQAYRRGDQEYSHRRQNRRSN